MTPFLAVLRGAAVAALACVPAACSLVGRPMPGTDGPFLRRHEEIPLPVATHRFEIDPQRDDVVGIVQRTTAGEEDTLSDIARRFDVGYEEIVRANPGVDPWLPGPGRQIVVPSRFVLPDAPREGVVINIAAMRLFYYPPRETGEPQVVYTHPIGIGKVGWATPEGVTKVVRRQLEPTWRPTPSIIEEHRKNGEDLPAVVGPGPDNPLGRHAFYLAWPSYLIHGTNKPYGVGLRSSHGCIRLYPEDMAVLFETVPLGTQVRVVNQPFVFGWDAEQLHLQAFDVLEDDPRDWKRAQRKLISRSLAARIQKELKKRSEEVNWELVSSLAHDPRGIPVPITRIDMSLDQVLANAMKVQNRVPEDSNWDGVSDLPVDEQTFQEMLSDSETEPTTDGAAPKTGT
jgi:L,D-transpeptidase ErfK/SrfK